MPRKFGVLSVIGCMLLSSWLPPSLRAFTEDPNRFIRTTEPRSPEEERKGFHMPEGFEVQLFADDIQLNGKPINMAFDARGRLWVTCTQEYPYAVKKDKWSPDTTRAPGSKDSIRILEDTDGDGRADKVTIFADDLNIPTGIVPYKNGCIAWSIPNILFLQDTQHEGRAEKADQRRILFGPLGYERDTHGMISSLRLGLDGWIYGTHGFSNASHFQVLPQNRSSNPQSEIQNQQLDISSGSVFRFRPDGSAVELWTHGQVNPFGLCWDSWNNLYSADCHSNPITQLIRGATYPQFGKTSDALGFGPVMCEHAHGSTGIAGIVYIDGGIWGPEWNDHMFVGNPVTSKVNHDHITFVGSSPTANEQPDFITSDDPWFRPVDLQLGPDGALYIADFYNRIIGHYEIPLDHPGRDRKSGRIWRVVKKGFAGKLADCDLSNTKPGRLVEKLGSSNLTLRGLALETLMNRPEVAFRGRSVLDRESDEYAKFLKEVTPAALLKGECPKIETALAHWLWRRANLQSATMDNRGLPPDDPLVAAHWAKAVSESNSAESRDFNSLGQLASTLDPRVMAVWLEQNQQLRRPDPVMLLRARVEMKPVEDVRKHFAWLLAMRWALSQLEDWHKLPPLRYADDMEKDLYLVASAIPKPEAAAWMLSRIQRYDSGDYLGHIGNLRSIFTHIARHLPAERRGELLEMVQKNFAGDLDAQLDLFFAVEKGRQARGNGMDKPDAATQAWARQLAQKLLLTFSENSAANWKVTTPPTEANPSPWFSTKRKCADGVEADFLDSHPPGGEKLTGALRSKAFPMPDTLTIWIAGHRGFPNGPAHEKNLVRLVDATTGEEISRAYPPRHDVARPVSWLCGDAAAKENTSAAETGAKPGPAPQTIHLAARVKGRWVCLEAVDGDSGSAYAWLALGRFNPPVVGVPDLKSQLRDRRVLALAKLCAPGMLPTSGDSAKLRDTCLDKLVQIPSKETLAADTRVAVVEAAAPRNPSPLARLLMPLVKDPAMATPWMNLLCDPHADLNVALVKDFKTATFRQQTAIAELLAATKQGAAALLDLAPPAVVAEPLVSSKIKALDDGTLSERLTKLTSALPPPNAAVKALITQRLRSFDPAKADKTRGQQIFAQTCTPCHRIGVTGNLVGPQLDGIGVRGPERLLEDILDPNREVDPAFRLHILKLKDGSVTTGLVRREQDGELVYADVTGQEHSVTKADVTGDDVSPFSLMPSGFGDVLTPQQLHDLLAYLLDRK